MDGKVQVSFITVAAAAVTGGHKQTAAAAAAARQKQPASGGIQARKCGVLKKSKIAEYSLLWRKASFYSPIRWQ